MTKEELLAKWGITEKFINTFIHGKLLLGREWYQEIDLALTDSLVAIQQNMYQVFLDEDRDLEDIYNDEVDDHISSFQNLLEDRYD